MKYIQIITEYKMRWVDYLLDTFRDWKFTCSNQARADLNPDIMVFMWADNTARDFINNNEKRCPYIVYLRAYEYAHIAWKEIHWHKVDKIMCVNDYIANIVEAELKIRPTVLYNGTNTSLWKFSERQHGKKIAQVCHIHYKKNHAMTMQIMSKLPRDYELHCAGGIQMPDVFYYMDHINQTFKTNVFLYHHVNEDKLDEWLEDKNYIISTSLREGSPNNIIEAMAKGIKPIVHNWPGSREQFGEYVFSTPEEAVKLILPDSEYDSRKYLDIVNTKFGMNQFREFKKIVEELV